MPKTRTALLEIVELASGEIALRRPEDTNNPLVAIRFSAESIEYLGEARHLIAKAMIEAGLEAVHDLREQGLDSALEDIEEIDDHDEFDTLDGAPVLH